MNAKQAIATLKMVLIKANELATKHEILFMLTMLTLLLIMSSVTYWALKFFN